MQPAELQPPRMSIGRVVSLLGPAFVASVAYVDPGNVAANMSAGADYGYLLVWVLVGACLMAMIVQYLSAKLGLVTGRSLSSMVKDSLAHHRQARPLRIGFALLPVLLQRCPAIRIIGRPPLPQSDASLWACSIRWPRRSVPGRAGWPQVD